MPGLLWIEGFQNVRAVDLAAAERYLAILEYHEQR